MSSKNEKQSTHVSEFRGFEQKSRTAKSKAISSKKSHLERKAKKAELEIETKKLELEIHKLKLRQLEIEEETSINHSQEADGTVTDVENNIQAWADLGKHCRYWRDEHSIYKTLCKDMKIKNSLRNRKRIYNAWKRFENDDQTISENGIHPQTTDQIFIDKNYECRNMFPSETFLNDEGIHSSTIIDERKILHDEFIGSCQFDNQDDVEEEEYLENGETSTLMPKTVRKTDQTYVDKPEGSLSFNKKSKADECIMVSGSNSASSGKNNSVVNCNPDTLLEDSEENPDITPETFDIPSVLLNLSSPGKSSDLLPLNSKNARSNVKNSFKDCHVKGVERSLVKKKLIHEMPLNYKKKTFLEANEKLLKHGKSLQNIKSDAVVRKIKSEVMGQLDRNKNELLDIILMQTDHPEFIKEVCVPFNVKLYSNEQLEVLKNENQKSGMQFIYFDATGGVVRSPIPNSNRIYFYTAVIRIGKPKRIYPVFSMISSTHDVNSIFRIMSDFRYFCEINNYWPAFSGVVSDFSFANLHAISKAFNRCSLLEYLQKCYILNENGQNLKDESLVGVHLCCAHYMKMVAKDVNNLAKNETQHTFLKDLIAALILMKTIREFDIAIKYVYILLKTEFVNRDTEIAIYSLRMHLSKKADQDHFDDEKLDDYETNNSKSDGLMKSSPYYKRFSQITNSIKLDNSTGAEDNPFYNDAFMDLILYKYLPLCPLWSALMLTDECSVSNSVVENYFGQLKRIRLGGSRNLRCSQFVRKLREDVVSLKIEGCLDIGKSRLTIGDPFDEKLSKEEWNKKPNKHTSTHFEGRFLKIVKKEKDKLFNTNIIFPEDDDELPFCAYCGHGIVDECTAWVKCDECEKWIHQMCAKVKKEDLEDTYLPAESAVDNAFVKSHSKIDLVKIENIKEEEDRNNEET
ncbi:unnamed protein product [Phaedon cochleariae]|uniref:Uncharacterized protein n=1 Tax=Phaedon cochleariae TaxID=80249 RepID=A0A9P0GIT7_PHACE|nr:unnamed protein product [Phaedon cochleariae]